jgi:hypothetical protein
MQTMQAMIPCNVAFLAIATLFYTWRDLYVPRRRDLAEKREGVALLLYAAAAHDCPSNGPGLESEIRQDSPRHAIDEWEDSEIDQPEKSSPMLALYRDVACRACDGKHTFHCPSKTERKAGSTYSFTCPVVRKSAWIWWLEKPEQVVELPTDVVLLTWVSV